MCHGATLGMSDFEYRMRMHLASEHGQLPEGQLEDLHRLHAQAHPDAGADHQSDALNFDAEAARLTAETQGVDLVQKLRSSQEDAVSEAPRMGGTKAPSRGWAYKLGGLYARFNRRPKAQRSRILIVALAGSALVAVLVTAGLDARRGAAEEARLEAEVDEILSSAAEENDRCARSFAYWTDEWLAGNDSRVARQFGAHPSIRRAIAEVGVKFTRLRFQSGPEAAFEAVQPDILMFCIENPDERLILLRAHPES